MDSNRALQVLQLDSNASLDDIKKAYRRIAKTCHPDKFSDLKEKSEAEDRIKEVNEAYNLLKYVWERKSNLDELNSAIFNPDSICVTSTSKGCEFFYERAKQRENNGQDLEALQDCTQAIRLNSDYLEAYQLRRFICLKLGYDNRARSDDKNIERLQQKSNQSKYKEAIENSYRSSNMPSRPSYKTPAQTSKNSHPEKTHNYSVDLEQLDQLNSNKSEMSQPNSVEPEVMSSNNAEVFYDRATQNFQKGQHQEAMKNCNRAIRLNSDYLEAYKLRRRICVLLGHKDRVAFDTKQINRIESNIAQSSQGNS